MNTYLEESIKVLSEGILKSRNENEIFILQTKMPGVQNKSIENYIS
jgi:hypothetical protein